MGHAPKVPKFALNRPAGTCQYCGQPLVRWWVSVIMPADNSACPSLVGDRPVISEKKVTTYGDGQVLWHLWFGDLGYDGNNHFCSLRCGYSYGVAVMAGFVSGRYRVIEIPQ